MPGTSGSPLEGEDAVLDIVHRVLGVAEGALRVGPGHDCALVDVGAGAAVVVTTDVLVDGVHFDLARDGPEAAAAKALLVNLSDLAAAAATPLAFEVGVVLPRGGDPSLAERLARGMARVARRWGCPAAGGDTNVADGPLVLAVTALGRPGPRGMVTRAGARPGDVLSVTGPLGGSLPSGRHLDFTPRLREGSRLVATGAVHAMMDLSDGLSRDLPRLCRASEVGAVIDGAAVPVHPDVGRTRDDRPALRRALDDGEDFELLVAHAPLDEATLEALAADGVMLHAVGRVVEATAGLVLVVEGRAEPWRAQGFDHFLSR